MTKIYLDFIFKMVYLYLKLNKKVNKNYERLQAIK